MDCRSSFRDFFRRRILCRETKQTMPTEREMRQMRPTKMKKYSHFGLRLLWAE